MELGDGAKTQIAQVDAARTQYSRRAGWLHWALICMMFKWEPLLFVGASSPPTLQECMAEEMRLLVFAHWLGRDYAYSTVVRYVGDVKAWQRQCTGIPLEALGVTFFRLPLLFRVLKREKPPKTHDKRPWEYEYFVRIARKTTGALVADFGRCEEGYELCTVWVMMLLAFEQLLRLSELVTTQVASIAQRNPLMMADRRYIDTKGRTVSFDHAGRPMMPADGATIDRCIMRMPPSKTDVVGTVDGLILPFPKNWRPDSKGAFTAAGPAMWRRDSQFPVPKEFWASTHLFGMRQWSRRGGESTLMTQTKFVSTRNKMCRKGMASPEIRYERLGIHAFRVGGCNRLMDLGASGPQICAAGRWAGDCWILYARRQRAVLTELTLRMAGA